MLDKGHRWFIKREHVSYFNAYSEKCHTSKLILTISWINSVLDKCYRWFIKREQVSYFIAYSEKCHTSKLILTISWINYVLDKCYRLFIKREQWSKTVIILATPFWVAGAVQSVKIGRIVIGASKKSGRRCKPSDEINLIYLMHLDLSATKRWSFWRHRFG